MWLTPNGEYCFADYSGSLLATGVIRIIENFHLEEAAGNRTILGVKMFDCMTCGEQIDSLQKLSLGLFCDDHPAPPLTIYNEVTLAAVFKKLRAEVEAEITWDDAILRNYILGVYECEMSDRRLKTDPFHRDVKIWHDILSEFQSHVLHERKFGEETLETLTWNRAELMLSFTKENLGYLTNPPVDHAVDQAKIHARETVSLCKNVIDVAELRL